MIRIGIIGYGNLGRGVEEAVRRQADLELVAIFSRRGPAGIDSQQPDLIKENITAIENYRDKIDVMILCGGSAKDLPEQSPLYAQAFNIVDSFDNHEAIPNHWRKVNEAAQKNGYLATISAGWDPGLFSMNRLLGEAVIPQGESYTFWGKGVSQGHSDAIRRVEGVKFGVQYTIPRTETVELVRRGEAPQLTTRDKHERLCFVVSQEGADEELIAQRIKSMPAYFADYDTTVYFIDEATFLAEHQAMPHGGMVIRSGKQQEKSQLLEFKLTLGSNPDFTAHVLVATARATFKLQQEGKRGAISLLDIPLRYLIDGSAEDIYRDYL